MILLLILAFSLFQISHNFLSQSPTWYSNPKFRAGTNRLVNTITGPSVNTFSSTFSSSLTTNPPFLAYGFKSYRGTDYLLQQYIAMQCTSLDPSGFSIELTITYVTNPILIDISYIAVDTDYPFYLNIFYDVPVNYSSINSVPLVNITTSSSSLQYFTNTIDYYNDLGFYNNNNTFSTPFSNYRIALLMSGFGFTSTTLVPVYLDVQATIVDAQTYLINVTFGYSATCTMLNHSHIIFDVSDYSTYGNNYLYFFQWTINNTLANNSYYQLNTVLRQQFIMGLKSFTAISGQCTLDYQWNYVTYNNGYSNVDGLQILPSSPYGNSTCGFSTSTSTVFYMMSWTCANPYIFLNVTTLMCQTSCGPFTYANYTDSTCRYCLNTLCYTCNSNASTICLSCDTNWVISGTTCICDTSVNMFINGSCYACGDLQFKCNDCSYSGDTSLAYDATQFICLGCDATTGYFITPSNTCGTCSVADCATCLGYSSCQVCNSGYGLTKAATCSTCPVDGCQTCINLTACSVCITGYLKIGYLCYSCPVTCTCGGYTLPYLSNGDCSTICGDGIIINPPEQCDDGNTVSGDGCSSKCLIQDYFVCNGTNNSVCYFNTDLQVVLLRSEGSTTTCNTIKFTFQIQPILSIMNTLNVNWMGFITPIDPSLTLIGSPYYSNNLLQLTYQFNRTIQSQWLTFNLNAQNIISASKYFSQIHNRSIQIQVLPINNIPAVLCTTNAQTAQSYSQAYGIAISTFGYLGMFLSIFSCKIVGLEMFGVMQLSYFVLSDYDNVNPVLSSILNRKEVNGLNIQSSSNTNYHLSARLLGNGFTSQIFLSNYNIMFLLTVILTVFGLFLYTITYIINKDSPTSRQLIQVLHSQKHVKDQPAEVARSLYWHKFSKFILKQVLMTFIIFNSLNLGFSTGLQILYISEVESLSIICMLVALSLMVVVGMAQLVTDKLQFGEYTLKFKQARFQSKYILTTMVYRFTLGLLMALLNEWTACCIILVFLSAAFLTYIFYFDPFTEQLQNIRSKIVHSVHVLILFVAFYYRLQSNYDAVQSQSILVPAYIQLVAVAFVVLGSTLMLSYELYIKLRDWFRSKQQQGDTIQDNSMRQKQQDNQPNIHFQTVEFIAE